MKRAASQRRVSLLLAVALLPNSVSPPSVHHSHAGGDRPHRHDPEDADHHDGHSHPRADDMHRNQPRRPTHDDGECGIAAAAPHVHLNFCGFDVTLPSSGSHEGDEGSEQDRELLSLVIAPAGVALITPPSLSLRGFALPPATMPAGRSIADEDWRVELSDRQSSIPLCDSARRERSGVLVV